MIETIKQKILQLDAGSFQNLCDSYLSKIGYQDIVSLGGKAGTRKTTLGTPDTYFSTPDDKYIFVEYTTQIEGLFKKIKEDLDKCLDESETSISHNDILEIIYCHTSANLRPSQDKDLKNFCQNVGIKLILIGIDKLAIDIYNNYRILARDFLGISIDSGQILTLDDFIEEYNSNKLAAPIDTEFLFREKEIEDINKAFEENNIVILGKIREKKIIKSDLERIRLTDTSIYIYSKDIDKAEIERKLLEWKVEKLKSILDEYLDKYTKLLDKNISYYHIKKLSSAWGIYHRKENYISFNFDLIEKDIECIEYVVLHELCHIFYMNHQKEFWTLVEKYMPNYKVRRKKLKTFI